MRTSTYVIMGSLFLGNNGQVITSEKALGGAKLGTLWESEYCFQRPSPDF